MSERRIFGYTKDQQPVYALTLDNDKICCEVLNFGAAIHSLWVPGCDGGKRDVVLGYASVAEYEKTTDYLGSVVGRYANRIAAGRFSLNGSQYTLACNNGKNHLHGGNCGFSHRLWSVEEHKADCLVLSLESADGEEGYPGRLQVRVCYQLQGTSLLISYRAISDQDTVCNLTNHSYFNLKGHDSGPVTDQKIQIFADFYTPIDPSSIPLAAHCPVENTPMDLRNAANIGQRMVEPDPQLLLAKGFDHNFVLQDGQSAWHPAAWAQAPDSGICLLVETSMPGLQFYTGNYLTPALPGKDGASYDAYHGFCLETQYFPDSPNRPDFPSALLKAGEIYEHSTRFSFSVAE